MQRRLQRPQIALALAEAFQCGVNDLPLSMVLSWYEQKAVCILLTLLHLGIRNIRLGPTLPAFLSPNVLQYLVEHYAIAPITTPGGGTLPLFWEAESKTEHPRHASAPKFYSASAAAWASRSALSARYISHHASTLLKT